jgi:hypothetical protein
VSGRKQKVTAETKDTLFGILERWGLPTLAAIALAWFIRSDLLLPLLEEHRLTLKEVRETQREIAEAVTEQTKLLYALQPKSGDRAVTVRAVESDSQPN